MRTFAAAILTSLVFCIAGCASLQDVDRSRLNHPAMDLTANRAAAKSSFLTTFDSIQGTPSGGGCTVCAH